MNAQHHKLTTQDEIALRQIGCFFNGVEYKDVRAKSLEGNSWRRSMLLVKLEIAIEAKDSKKADWFRDQLMKHPT